MKPKVSPKIEDRERKGNMGMKPKVGPKMKQSVLLDWLVDNAILGDDDRTFVLDKVVSFLKVSSDVADGKPSGSQKWVGIVRS